MVLTIQNEYLQLSVDTHGAQMMSILGKDGCEYLWQGDPAYWQDRAPVLFPFIARLDRKQYQLDGCVYSIESHGFAASLEFTAEAQTQDCLTLRLQSTPETLAQYPFAFTLEITYRLNGCAVAVEYRVINRDQRTMYFGLGGHPGFRVPLNGGEVFDDYYLEFSQSCLPDRFGFTEETILMNGKLERYPLENGKVLPLNHHLFDDDAIILQNMAREVSLRSHRSPRSLTVSYPNMPYLGIWHWPHRDAPYVCIEPWTSLPGRSGVLEDISCRTDYVRLEPGKTYENIWTITIRQEE